MPLRSWVEVFQRLPELAQQHGYRIEAQDVQALLGGNAARILGLAERP